MATAISPAERAKFAGIPRQDTQDILVTPEGFITGDYPAKLTEDNTFAASQTIPAYTPVGYDTDGNLVPAQWHATYSGGGIRAVGFTFFDIVTPASPVKGIPIYRSGVFNPFFAGITWHASFDTDEKKLEAFRGAPAPTQIVMRPIKSATVVLP